MPSRRDFLRLLAGASVAAPAAALMAPRGSLMSSAPAAEPKAIHSVTEAIRSHDHLFIFHLRGHGWAAHHMPGADYFGPRAPIYHPTLWEALGSDVRPTTRERKIIEEAEAAPHEPIYGNLRPGEPCGYYQEVVGFVQVHEWWPSEFGARCGWLRGDALMPLTWQTATEANLWSKFYAGNGEPLSREMLYEQILGQPCRCWRCRSIGHPKGLILDDLVDDDRRHIGILNHLYAEAPGWYSDLRGHGATFIGLQPRRRTFADLCRAGVL